MPNCMIMTKHNDWDELYMHISDVFTYDAAYYIDLSCL